MMEIGDRPVMTRSRLVQTEPLFGDGIVFAVEAFAWSRVRLTDHA
jgi:hypothetical protein